MGFSLLVVGSGYLVIWMPASGIVDFTGPIFRLTWPTHTRASTGTSH
jgi:hypothetical protein